MTQPLSGLHLLVTRPKAQGEPWSAQLQALGAEVTQEPMLLISPFIEGVSEYKRIQQIKSLILRLDEFSKIIFVSQNAVNHCIPWIDQYWPQLPDEPEFFAIGSATAHHLQEQLNQLGTALVTQPQAAMNSEALLDLASMKQVNGEKIAIVRGDGGRTLLGNALSERGASISYIEVYERIAPTINPLDNITAYLSSTKQKITVAHSTETLENLCNIIPENLLRSIQALPLLVPGQRVCDYAHKKGFNPIITAENATHTSMTEALYDWRTG